MMKGMDEARVRGWLDRFRFYRNPPDQSRIEDWLSQFEEKDLAVA
jgi:hypothetical protein